MWLRKGGFDFGISKLTNLITKVKHPFEISYDDLKAKPSLIECDDLNFKMLEQEIIESSDVFQDNAKKYAEKYLATKFFPIELRIKVWYSMIENKHRINPKLYKYYKETIDKKLKENDSFGNLV